MFVNSVPILVHAMPILDKEMMESFDKSQAEELTLPVDAEKSTYTESLVGG